jgi:hypothetical protein
MNIYFLIYPSLIIYSQIYGVYLPEAMLSKCSNLTSSKFKVIYNELIIYNRFYFLIGLLMMQFRPALDNYRKVGNFIILDFYIIDVKSK